MGVTMDTGKSNQTHYKNSREPPSRLTLQHSTVILLKIQDLSN
jgi:hypothetical protein